VNTIDWNNPDQWLAALLLPENDQVYGKVKSEFGLLEGIPKPETRLFFNDIVKVTGPFGTQKYRDDDIEVYKVEQLEVRSSFNTFGFKARLPDYRTYFALGDVFQENGLKARISWIDDKNPLEWKDCLGAAETIGKAKELLRRFLKQNKKARIKDLVEFNCTG
jgi:hypothetical protein